MISAIIITYLPERERVLSLASCLASQVDHVLIIDNSPVNSQFSLTSSLSKVVIHHLGRNVGIAQAQNIGIAKAKEWGSRDVILFDQDSVPSPTLVQDLLDARDIATRDGINVAAVGPVHFDLDSGSPSRFICAKALTLKLVTPDFKSAYFTADFIIASGSLISIEALDTIGLMENELFIDCVDIEWGYRARAKGRVCVVAQAARMDHKIGDKPLILFGRQITTHSPLRHYYFFRNVVLLLKRKYMPVGWKINVSVKSLMQAIIFTFFLSPRYMHFKYITKGFLHGILGRTGPYER
ncbi:glycosyltransferase family 2 protein [Kosakonia sp. WA-90]|uniref:glycosyltransferase family 2 protein n=1 Tax=Kosakonia sp. WA-90 TaxID=3153576 RepID=UPI00325D7459